MPKKQKEKINYKHLEPEYYQKMKESQTEEERMHWRNMLVSLNLPLAKKLCYEYVRELKTESFSFEDLEQCAYIGLIKCVEAYDPEKGKIGTLLPFYIRSVIQREVDKHDRMVYIPAHSKKEYFTYRTQKEQENITLDEFCNYNPFTKTRIIETARALMPMVYIDGPRQSDEESVSLHEILTDEADDMDDNLWVQDFYKTLEFCKEKSLSDKEFDILCKRFGLYDKDKQTLEEISQELGVTRERVRQIESKALKKLAKVYQKRLRSLYDTCPSGVAHSFVLITSNHSKHRENS